MKNKIEELLLSTGRTGMKDLLVWMEENKFYQMPCSGGKHMAREGGLAEHSLNVFQVMQNALYFLKYKFLLLYL